MPNILSRLKIREISAVDRGAGQDVKILMVKRKPQAKREFSSKEREEAAESGAAMPGGGFPIKNASDLHNAMQAIGRAKDPAAAKAHIRSRARALGLTDQLTDAFKREVPMSKMQEFLEKLFGTPNAREAEIEKATARLATSVKSIVDDGGVADKGTLLAKTFGQFHEHLEGVTKALPATADPPTSTGDNEMSPKVLKALGLAEGASEEQILKALADQRHQLAIAKADMTAAEKAFHDELDDKEDDEEEEEEKERNGNGKNGKKKSFRAMTHEQRKAAMDKRDELPEHVRKQLEEHAQLKKSLDALLSERELVNLTKHAVEHGLPDSEGATLQKAYRGDKQAIDKLLGFTKSALAAAHAGGVFKEFGGTGGATQATPYDELMAKAAELRKIDPKLSVHQAFTKVYTDPANIEIVKRERSDNRPSAS